MTQAFATRMPRGFSWVWLAIAAVALTPATLQAQSSPAAKDDKKAPVEDAKEEDPAPAPTEQVFVDPNAKKALTVFNPLTFQGPGMKVMGAGDDKVKIQGMAGRSVNIEPDYIKRYVEFFAAELTKRENLNAVLNPPANLKPNDAPSRALERAVDSLNKPIIDGKANDNKEFLAVYYQTLFEFLARQAARAQPQLPLPDRRHDRPGDGGQPESRRPRPLHQPAQEARPARLGEALGRSRAHERHPARRGQPRRGQGEPGGRCLDRVARKRPEAPLAGPDACPRGARVAPRGDRQSRGRSTPPRSP